MKSSTIVWTALLVFGVGFLAVRTTTGQMGRSYVRVVPVTPEGSDITWNKEVSANASELGQPDVRFSWSRTLGLWTAALCTLCILSFLWGDNFFYKLAEAVFVGSSAAYAMTVAFWTGIIEILFKNLTPQQVRGSFLPTIPETDAPNLIFIIPLVLGVAMLWRLAPAGGWISRWPLAFFIGATAGLKLIVHFESDFMRQIQATILPLIVLTVDGGIDWGASLRNSTIVAGVLACLVYFFFSVEHKGAVGGIARLGIWFLMITFGAGFGYTVMGRIALLSGRLEFLFDDWLWLIDPVGKRLVM